MTHGSAKSLAKDKSFLFYMCKCNVNISNFNFYGAFNGKQTAKSTVKKDVSNHWGCAWERMDYTLMRVLMCHLSEGRGMGFMA